MERADAMMCLDGSGRKQASEREKEVMRMEYEDKALFDQRLNEALIECGARRYDYLIGEPLTYERVGADERVHQGGKVANVSMDSLTALMCDVHEQIFR